MAPYQLEMLRIREIIMGVTAQAEVVRVSIRLGVGSLVMCPDRLRKEGVWAHKIC